MVVFNERMAIDLLSGFGMGVSEINNGRYGIEITNYQNGEEVSTAFLHCGNGEKGHVEEVFKQIVKAYAGNSPSIYIGGSTNENETE